MDGFCCWSCVSQQCIKSIFDLDSLTNENVGEAYSLKSLCPLFVLYLHFIANKAVLHSLSEICSTASKLNSEHSSNLHLPSHVV